jgi:hypothetical protein
MLGAGGGLGGRWDNSVWMVSARSDVKNVVGKERQDVEQQWTMPDIAQLV